MVVLRRSVALLRRFALNSASSHNHLGKPPGSPPSPTAEMFLEAGVASARLAGPATAGNISLSSLGPHLGAAVAGSQPAPGAAAAAALAAAASPSQLLHARSFAAGSGRTAALRRLRRAGVRAVMGGWP
ncbi:hypothetical protein ABPG77_010261 [Micractinium sp. CCAP 211/92]